MVDTINKVPVLGFTLLLSGSTTYTVDTSPIDHTFTPIAIIPLQGIDLSRIKVLGYFRTSLQPKSSILPNNILLPVNPINTFNVLYLMYKFIDGDLVIGYYSFIGGATLLLPYQTIVLDWFVQYF